MSLDDFKRGYKAAYRSGVEMPFWAAVLPFAVVGIIDITKALHHHDVADVAVSAIIWLLLAPLGYIWFYRKR